MPNHRRWQWQQHSKPTERFGVDWTPTIVILDCKGKEAHRIEGFLPADDFLGQLQLGLGHAQFASKNIADAERQFRDACENLSGTDAARTRFGRRMR